MQTTDLGVRVVAKGDEVTVVAECHHPPGVVFRDGEQCLECPGHSPPNGRQEVVENEVWVHLCEREMSWIYVK